MEDEQYFHVKLESNQLLFLAELLFMRYLAATRIIMYRSATGTLNPYNQMIAYGTIASVEHMFEALFYEPLQNHEFCEVFKEHFANHPQRSFTSPVFRRLICKMSAEEA